MRTWLLAIAAVAACGRLHFDTTGDAAGGDAGVPSLPVPGGSFFRGYDVAADGIHGTMAYPASISSFHLDKYEVTVGRFRAFVAAGMGTQASAPADGAGTHPHLVNSGWQAAWDVDLQPDTASLVAAIDGDCMQGSGAAIDKTWTDTPAGNENRPIVCIDWYEAFAFCIWDGGYLPTLAESMYAASGGADQRAYPWSMPFGSLAIDPSDASYFDGTNCVGDGMAGCAYTDMVDVGTKPAGDGAFGQSDLAGNVSELVLDWQIANDVFPTPCTDCAQLADPGPGQHITYEGAYDSPVTDQRAAEQEFTVGPSERWHNVGTRCARP